MYEAKEHEDKIMGEGFFSNKKLPLVITLLIIVIGSLFYLSLENKGETIKVSRVNPQIYNDLLTKVAYTSEGQIKVFAQTGNNRLSKLKVSEGNPIPETDSIVIGYEEAKIMKKEKIFTKPKDKIKDFFGVDVKIEGILEETNSPLDDFHFVSLQTLSNLDGDFDRIYVKLNPENVPKTFYKLDINETPKFNFSLSEGNIKNYNQIHEIAGERYYPIIIGSKEAKIMKEEGLFNKSGDIIKGFFGKNVIIVGIITETNSSLDIMHIFPLDEGDLK